MGMFYLIQVRRRFEANICGPLVYFGTKQRQIRRGYFLIVLVLQVAFLVELCSQFFFENERSMLFLSLSLSFLLLLFLKKILIIFKTKYNKTK
jgi:hypothetical protein